MKVSSSASVSWFVAIVPAPVVEPALMVIDERVPTSPDSAVFGEAVETDTGIVTALDSAHDSLAVTVAEDPSTTVVGAAESVTSGKPALPVTDAQGLAKLTTPCALTITRR